MYKYTPGIKMRVKMYIDFPFYLLPSLFFFSLHPVPYIPHTVLLPVLEKSYTLLNLTKI